MEGTARYLRGAGLAWCVLWVVFNHTAMGQEMKGIGGSGNHVGRTAETDHEKGDMSWRLKWLQVRSIAKRGLASGITVV